jgi:pyruvate kinase
VTDVANAMFGQADSVMLSGETTVGKYSLKCLEVLDRIAQRIERSGGTRYADKTELTEERQKIVRSAVVMANEPKPKGVLAFTRYGHMAQYTPWLRPEHSPILAFTNSERLCNQLTLYWGVTPRVIQFSDDPEVTILRAKPSLLEHGLVGKGDQVVIISEILARDRLITAAQMHIAE